MDGRKDLGDYGENTAASFLVGRGYTILRRNYKTKIGEIDIIAEKNSTLIFVEVKTLPRGNFDILSKVLGKRKQKRIIDSAKLFLLSNKEYLNRHARFDAIVIDMPGLPKVYHIKNAFVSSTI